MSDQDTATTEWFDSVIGSDSGREASNKTGIPRMTLQRIRTGENLKAEQVIAVARAYNYPTVQALVITGFLRKDEVFSSNMRSTLTYASRRSSPRPSRPRICAQNVSKQKSAPPRRIRNGA